MGTLGEEDFHSPKLLKETYQKYCTFRQFPHTEGSSISNYELETGIGYNNRCEFYDLLSIMNV